MRVAQGGGFSAPLITMQSLGLMPIKESIAEPIAAAKDVGKGVKLVVLGGEVSGLTTGC